MRGKGNDWSQCKGRDGGTGREQMQGKGSGGRRREGREEGVTGVEGGERMRNREGNEGKRRE